MRLNLIKPLQVQIDHIATIEGRWLYLEAREPDNTQIKERIVRAIEREFAPDGGLKIFRPEESQN